MSLSCDHAPACDRHMTMSLGMFVSSCRDGCICVWDTRCSSGVAGHKPANSIASGHSPVGGHPPRKKRRDSLSGGGNACVTAVLFHGDDKIASAGAGDG